MIKFKKAISIIIASVVLVMSTTTSAWAESAEASLPEDIQIDSQIDNQIVTEETETMPISIEPEIAESIRGTWLSVSSTSVNCTYQESLITTISVSCSDPNWTMSDNLSWLGSGRAGGTSSTIITVSRNNSTAPRSGTITVKGAGLTRTITVTQSAGYWSYMFHAATPPATHISSPYGDRTSNGITKFHSGFDITTGVTGKIKDYPVYNVSDGTVFFNGKFSDGETTCVAVKQADGYTVRYLHLNTRTGASEGSKISTGDSIGTVGDKGSPGEYHLHFDINTINTINGPSLTKLNTVNPVNFFQI